MTSPLNPGQRAAVDSRRRKVVVSAGAGSGKTRVLAERFADAVLGAEVAGHRAPLRSVLLITFTEKAAGELVERVRRVLIERDRADLAREVDGAWISTIHGFCARIVRRHALELDVDPAFGVLVDPQVGVVRREAFERAAKGLLADTGVERLMAAYGVASLRETVIAAADRVRSKGMSVGDVEATAPADVSGALSALSETLEAVLGDYGQLKQTDTVLGNLTRFTELAAGIDRLRAEATQPSGLHAASRLGDYRGKRSGGAEMKELTDQVNLAIGGVCQAAVDTIASQDSDAWCSLLREYEAVYEREKALLGVLDFEDLQLRTRRLWQEDPRAARRYADQFTQVMIDEFQDTNGLQFQAIEPVAGHGLCLVGDVQQSIYRFRDADVSLFTEQRRRATGVDDGDACELTVNYRSHRELLGTLNALFRSPQLFGDDYLHLDHGSERPGSVSWPAGSPRAEAFIVDSRGWTGMSWREAEARVLARRIRLFVDEGRMAPDDVVVLVRSGNTMPIYASALRAVGFDVHAAAAGGFFATSEVADARALLKVLANSLDGEGVLQLLAGGLGGLSDDALLLIAAPRPAAGLWAALENVGDLGLAPEDTIRAELLHRTVETLRGELGRIRLADAILLAVDALAPGGGCLGIRGASANLGKIARLAAEFERTTPADPSAFLRYLDERESFVRREASAETAVEGSGAIRVMTVHSAKGLEFPVVAVADLGHANHAGHPRFMLAERDGGLVATARVDVTALAGSSPEASAWLEAGAADAVLDLEESKRVFYVACTRAEQVLLLAGSADLGKEPGDALAIDWLRRAVHAAGPGGIPGLSVTTVTSEQEEDLATAEGEGRIGENPAVTDTPSAHMVLAPPVALAPPKETSYTALALYERCAYRFFAERVLGIGGVDVPGGADPRALGSALHGALQCRAEGRPVDERRLRALASAHRLAEDELPRLAAALEAFFASDAGPLLDTGVAEMPFAVPVEGGVVAGSMDLVVRSGSDATVVDYKTGLDAPPDDSRYAGQADVYGLALLAAGCESVAVRFVRVEQAGAETVFRYTAADRDAIMARVERAFARMAAGEYERRDSFDASVCPDCPVSGSLCPVVHPGMKPSR